MKDKIVRATAANHQIRAFAISSKNLVEEARLAHQTSPVVTAALGRLLSAAAMMGVMMKGERDLITLQIKSEGPIEGMTVTADAMGRVKGYPNVSVVDLDLNENGKLDVGTAVGPGVLYVMKDLGLKEPYVGRTNLQTGEIAEDLTYYYAISEQTPSSVGLGVLVDTDQTVRQAGGFIIQLMPDVTDETIEKLEARIQNMKSVTTLLEEGISPEGLLEELLGDMDLEINASVPTEFFCDCSKEKVAKAIASISKDEVRAIIDENEPIEVKCHFCNGAYEFSIEDLKEITGL
ncbi:MAG: Hsp33 family molecular chaperone HslO [Lachnospiraceae bacterium]|nr:Hsp33 family molecular chaperone HslO [Lachnospiraceae bacterium]